MTTQQGETGGDVGTIELRGKVKWFNAVKGYGFLALDSDNSDAFLHVTTLRQAGHEDLKPAQQVVCAGVRGPKGWQVMKVLDVDSSTAVAVVPKAPAVPDGIAMGDYITALSNGTTTNAAMASSRVKPATATSSCMPRCCAGTAWNRWRRDRR
jgi:CspA family cold shock protein